MVIAGALVFSGALDYAFDRVFHPWSLATPPLTGFWTGRLVTGAGTPLVIHLEMRRARTSRDRVPCARCSQIDGHIESCDAAGTLRRYRLSGSPDDRRGRTLHIGAIPVADPPPDGLQLDVLRGSWDGQDQLSLQAGFFWRKGPSAISSTDDPATQPVPVVLTRGRAPSPGWCRAGVAGD